MKTVIHIWAQEYKKYNANGGPWAGFYGLGDLIRGSIGVYRLCKLNGYNFIVDISLHPLSSCLKVTPHLYSSYVQEQKNIVAVAAMDVESYIMNKLETSDVVAIGTNCDTNEFDTPASLDLKEFIKGLFILTDKFNTYMLDRLQTIPFATYDIIHVRLGDDALFTNNAKSINAWVDKLESIKSVNSILISDTKKLKDRSTIFSIDAKIAHVGSSTDIDAIMHTLFEFLLLTTAKNILSYSTYNWKSGFTRIANFIYDVPLESHMNVTPSKYAYKRSLEASKYAYKLGPLVSKYAYKLGPIASKYGGKQGSVGVYFNYNK